MSDAALLMANVAAVYFRCRAKRLRGNRDRSHGLHVQCEADFLSHEKRTELQDLVPGQEHLPLSSH